MIINCDKEIILRTLNIYLFNKYFTRNVYINIKILNKEMETQNTFAKIFENQSVTVSVLLCAETLKINVKVNDETN